MYAARDVNPGSVVEMGRSLKEYHVDLRVESVLDIFQVQPAEMMAIREHQTRTTRNSVDAGIDRELDHR